MRARRIARASQAQEIVADPTEARGITVLDHPSRSPSNPRLNWPVRRILLLVTIVVAGLAAVYLLYLVTVAVLRSDFYRANADVNQRVQAQSVELARLQSKSADLEAKLAAAMTDLGIVRSKLQLQRATLRAYQARTHLAQGDSGQALKDLNDVGQALDAARAIASPDVKAQIGTASDLVRAAEVEIRGRNHAAPALDRLHDQLAVLSAD